MQSFAQRVEMSCRRQATIFSGFDLWQPNGKTSCRTVENLDVRAGGVGGRPGGGRPQSGRGGGYGSRDGGRGGGGRQYKKTEFERYK